jgi:hypothetical protein
MTTGGEQRDELTTVRNTNDTTMKRHTSTGRGIAGDTHELAR